LYLRLTEKKEILMKKEYEVVVAGGGIAGVAAAVAAARNNSRVCMIEKQCFPGGLATLGNVVVYLPLCDGMGRQVAGGLGEEFLKLSVAGQPDRIPECWRENGDKSLRLKNRYRARFNPASFMLALENLLVETGVDIFYDTKAVDIEKKGSRITAVAIHNKDGFSLIRCAVVVDATGDADICVFAGEETVSLDTNFGAGWFFYMDSGEIKLMPLADGYDPLGKVCEGKPQFSGCTAEGVNSHLLYSHGLVREKLESMKKETPGIYPLLLPSIPCFRMTRRLKGEIELNEDDERTRFPDTVGMTGDWRKAGPVYYIPFRALAGVKNKNLVTAGRCISADTAWDVTRAIPACAVTGEAAGTAASMLCSEKAESFYALDRKSLQKKLAKQNVILDLPV